MNVKKLIGLIAVFMLSAALASAGDKVNLPGSRHDLNSNNCATCHIPHSGPHGTNLLWNLAYTPTASFDVYSTTTSAALTAPTGPGDAQNHSWLCLSCHDGAGATANSAVLTGTNPAKVSGSTLTPVGLTDDHPVNTTYPAGGVGTGYKALTTVQASPNVRLWGATNDSVQCATCHDPHDNTNLNFLRVSNASAVLCLTCHQ